MGIWEEFRWKRGDLAGFAGLVGVGRILLVAGGLAGFAGLAEEVVVRIQLVKGCPRRLCRLREPFRSPRGPCKINKDTQGIRGLRPLNSYNGCPYVSSLTTGSRYTNFASLARCKFLEYLYLSCGK